jgi:hypothetical protein
LIGSRLRISWKGVETSQQSATVSVVFIEHSNAAGAPELRRELASAIPLRESLEMMQKD